MQIIYAITFFYFLGIVAGRFHALPLWALGAALLPTAAAAIALRRREPAFSAAVCVFAFLVSLFMYQADWQLGESNTLAEYLRRRGDNRQLEQVVGTITSVRPASGGGTRLTLDAEKVRLGPGKKLEVDGRLSMISPVEMGRRPRYGERWAIEGWVKPASEMKPGPRIFYRLQRINARLYPAPEGRFELVGAGDVPGLMRAGSAARWQFEEILEEHIDAPYNQVLGRMLLGKEQELDEGIVEIFRRAGLAHVLVVSGLHVWIMLGTFLFISFLWNRRPGISFVILSAVLLMYYGVTGGGASITRATIMGFVFLAAMLFGADYRAKTALFLAALVMMVMNPLSVYQVGMQLTFLASAGVIFIYPELAAFYPKRTWRFRILRGFLVAVAAQLPLFPVLAYHFNQFCAVSPLSNIVVVPLIGVLLPLDIATCIAGLIPGPLVAAPAFLAETLTRVVLACANFFAALPGSNIQVGSPALWWIALYEATLAAGVYTLARLRDGTDRQINFGAAAAAAGVLVLLFPSLWRFQPPGIRAAFIDVGEGDAALVEIPRGASGGTFRLLVDAGGTWGIYEELFDPGEKSVGRYLRKRGIRRIDAVLLTHAEADHMNGLQWVLDNVRVDRFLDVGTPLAETCDVFPGVARCAKLAGLEEGPAMAPAQRARYRNLLLTAKDRGIKYVPVSSGLAIDLDSGARISVLSPDPAMIANAGSDSCVNDLSAVVKIEYGEGSLLLTGDIQFEAEERLVRFQEERLKSTLLKVPHHGSSSSSSWRFLQAVAPEVAVISTGGPAFYGHPHDETIDRYLRKGVKIFRTDKEGTVTCGIGTKAEVRCRPEFMFPGL